MFPALTLVNLGKKPYVDTWEAMKTFTENRDKRSNDEIWFVEHQPVYTLGRTGNSAQLPESLNIPLIHSDRGGQVTYHGPGQLVCYLLLDIRRLSLGVRELVTAIEETVIELIGAHGVLGQSKAEAPGVYVDGKKIASLGLRVRRGASYHGLSLNVDMDLEPFMNINPCGFEGLEVVDLMSLGVSNSIAEIRNELADILIRKIGYSDINLRGK